VRLLAALACHVLGWAGCSAGRACSARALAALPGWLAARAVVVPRELLVAVGQQRRPKRLAQCVRSRAAGLLAAGGGVARSRGHACKPKNRSNRREEDE